MQDEMLALDQAGLFQALDHSAHGGVEYSALVDHADAMELRGGLPLRNQREQQRDADG
jgi:hypothetical protein